MPVAVITGSSSGIGRQTALEFAGLGYAVVLHARHNLRGLQHVAEAAELGVADVRCITADISKPEACSDLVSTAFAWQGAVDVWVNNAGVDVLTNHARRLSFDEKLQQLLVTDVSGTIRLSRDVVGRMQDTQQTDAAAQPTIINMGWDQAWLGMEGESRATVLHLQGGGDGIQSGVGDELWTAYARELCGTRMDQNGLG